MRQVALIAPLELAGYAFATFLLAAVSVAFIKRWAQHRLLDIPGERSSHVRPTPRGGGLAIAAVASASWLFYCSSAARAERIPIAFALTGAAIVALVSWFDDLKSLSWRLRILAHSLAAFMLLAGVWPLPSLDSVPAAVTMVVVLAWIVGLTNAYNFMDGIDGIAAGQAIVAGIGWTLLGWLAHNSMLMIIGLTIAGASGGFLVHNWPPASIFMGDVGAAFLGFMFAALPVMAWRVNPLLVPAGPLLVWPFLLDTSFTFFRRLWRGENVVVAHRSHLYQRLVITGMTHGQVALIYATLAIFGLLAAVAILKSEWILAVDSIISIVAAAVVLHVLVLRREAHAVHASNLPS